MAGLIRRASSLGPRRARLGEEVVVVLGVCKVAGVSQRLCRSLTCRAAGAMTAALLGSGRVSFVGVECGDALGVGALVGEIDVFDAALVVKPGLPVTEM